MADSNLLFQLFNWFLPERTKALDVVQNKPKEIKHGATFAKPLGVNPTYSPETALSAFAGHGYVYAAVSRASEDLSALPLRLLKGKDRVLVEDHPVIDLLNNPNSSTDSFLFREQITVDLMMTGNCFVLLLGVTEKPTSIIRLHPQNVKITTDQTGVSGYVYISGGQRIKYPKERIIHCRLSSWADGPQGLYGTGAIEPLARELKADINSQNLVSDASAKARPDLLISPSDPSDIWGPEHRREIASEYKKLSQSGGAMVLSGLAKVEPLQLSPREMEYTKAREMARESISAVTGVPPSVLGLPDANYATARNQVKTYWSNLTKKGKRLSILYTAIAKRFDDDLIFEHDYSGVEALQSTRTEQLNRVQIHIMNGINPREAYRYEGLDFPADIEGSEADNSDETAEDARSFLARMYEKAIIKDDDLSTYANRKEAFASLNENTQKALEKKVADHKEEVGDDARKQTDKYLLAVSYLRGIGAYSGSPESVRPSINSAEQWAMARVNGLLYALRNLRFRRKPYDTDLLPEEHPLSSRGEDQEKRHLLFGFEDLPLAPKETDWGFTKREADKILGDDDFNEYEKAFLFVYKGREDDSRGYRLPIAKMIDGELKVVFRGVIAAASSLRGEPKFNSGFYNLNGISAQDKNRMYGIIKNLYADFGEEAPEFKTKAVGDVDPTNFPSDGKDEEVSLKNSKYQVFDYEYAQDLKENYPEIWKAGGNIEGNNQFRRLSPVVRRESQSATTETEEMAIRKREAWIARHFDDGGQFDREDPPNATISSIAGIVAQIKWFAVGVLGEQRMKQIIDEVKKKQTVEKARTDLWKSYMRSYNEPAYKELLRASKAYLDGAAVRAKKRVLENVTGSKTKGVIDFKSLLDEDEEVRIASIIIGQPWRKWYTKTGTEELKAILKLAGVEIVEGVSVDDKSIDEFIQLFSRRIARTRSNGITGIVEQGLIDGLSVEDIAENVATSSDFSIGAARRIAQTESTRTTNLGANQAYNDAASMGIQVRKQWLTARDSKVRDTHAYLDGQTVGTAENFTLPTGEAGISPGSFDDAVENYNCRCTMIPIVD